VSGERYYHIMFSKAGAATSFIIMASISGEIPKLIVVCFATSFSWGANTILLAWMSHTMPKDSLSVSFGIVISVANFGGILGPFIMGVTKEETGDYNLGLYVLSGFEIACSFCAYLAYRIIKTNEGEPWSIFGSAYVLKCGRKILRI